ncbi:MAG: sulfotransferase family protein [Moorea sp. SIO2B7]|nr:sulfotransferase family protein [Moorena sp. SIO2B7]
MINKIYKIIEIKISQRQATKKYQKVIEQIRQNGFWFVDIPRTSSTSIKVELGNYYGSLYGKNTVLEDEYNYQEKSYFNNHLTARQMKGKLPKGLWDELFTFSLVRNPWDRMVSLYFYRQKTGELSEKISFEEYINQLKSPRYNRIGSIHSFYGYYYGNCEYILDGKDNIIVDFVGKYEERESAIKIIAEKINYPSLGKLKLQQAKSKDLHYSKLYNHETKKLVEEVFKKDIEMFAYEFEDL